MAEPYTHEVYEDDNFHYMDESAREFIGTYETLEQAVALCRGIVEHWLQTHYEAGMTSADLFKQYRNFGPDPFVRTTAPHDGPPFSGWRYAEKRAAEICGEASQPKPGDQP